MKGYVQKKKTHSKNSKCNIMRNDDIGSILCTYVYYRRRLLILIIPSTPFLIIGFLALITVCICLLLKKKPLNEIVLFGAFGIYILILIACIWFPIFIQPGFRLPESSLVQPIPFFTIMKDLSSGSISDIGRDICANILMTVPYGMMIPFLFKLKKRWQYVFHVFALPVAIEFSQFLLCIALDSHYRTADIDDVLLNALGILTGYVLYKYLPHNIKVFFESK